MRYVLKGVSGKFRSLRTGKCGVQMTVLYRAWISIFTTSGPGDGPKPAEDTATN